jgi:TRAP-type mannitol/chloroaromatic compound transport system permease small subunit
MIRIAGHYVRIIDAVNRRIGRMMMYGIFVMVAILLWSSISKTFFLPSRWTLEVAQFAMVAYYILGGPYSIQLGANVRMDLFYGEWTDRRKAQVDAITVLFLITYLGVLLYGAFDSTAYSLGKPYKMESFEFFKSLFIGFFTGGFDGLQEVVGRLERSATAWRPVLWPIKVTMIIGIILMLLQAVSELIKDIAKIKGVTL